MAIWCWKATAHKIRKLKNGGCGLRRLHRRRLRAAERLEGKVEQYKGNLPRAVCGTGQRVGAPTGPCGRSKPCWSPPSKESLLLLTGQGDVVGNRTDGIIGIGSAGLSRWRAARALLKHTQLTPPARLLRKRGRGRAICIYTNTSGGGRDRVSAVSNLLYRRLPVGWAWIARSGARSK